MNQFSPNFVTLLQHWQALEKNPPCPDVHSPETTNPTAVKTGQGNEAVDEPLDQIEERDPRYDDPSNTESNHMTKDAMKRNQTHHQRAASILNLAPHYDHDEPGAKCYREMEYGFSENSTGVAELPSESGYVRTDAEEQSPHAPSQSRKKYHRAPLPKFSDLKGLPGKIPAAFMKILNSHGAGKFRSGVNQEAKREVIVSYPVPTHDQTEFLIQAQQYRKTARLFHMQGGDLNTTITLYEQAIDILIKHHCNGGKYFGTVMFEYGVVLSNVKRHHDAAKCFLLADDLGVNLDNYYKNKN